MTKVMNHAKNISKTHNNYPPVPRLILYNLKYINSVVIV